MAGTPWRALVFAGCLSLFEWLRENVHARGASVGAQELIKDATGYDLRHLVIGSEGTLGIITSAIVKIFPLPEVQQYGSVLFPTFQR